ncbi:glycosyltransferase family 1 protein [Rathayibacter sp. VKM Ac-2803]|uniref:rhamnosyltransferase WsaF family glycosyltransferase n=1 Tax=unclassified Rathayibacter TaxID=2609250 RepID=UPI0013575B5D|nr:MULTISPECIES: glycosyltransferase family 1 protein [unclassified Rathayibacter]MWV49735.1 glycosyltransferase family 1 protein [Rathayibacter sp. VKM Ac-2803]MWV59868.1 glycosyltransferase family 1 protein [Rathayibacter sp. VKM Ac-2754]
MRAVRVPRELVRRLRTTGRRDLVQRAVRALGDRVGVGELDMPLLPGDIADSATLRLPGAPGPVEGPAALGWICTPPDRGSGGHTTLFRMVQGLVERGHRCTLFLYDRHGAEFEQRAAIIRASWPWLDVDIRSADDGIVGVDAAIATSWETAHVLATRGTAPMARLYFVQDFEPFFHPRGTLAALAEDSYRFGFRMIALGEMVRSHLDGLGIESDLAPFGCDTRTYTLQNADGERSGVVFYAKPSADRRGYLLGRRALSLFHEAHPTVPIHVYGTAPGAWDVPVIEHGTLAPAELAALYNRCSAGIALSFTNISLVAEELLACGVVAVVNDSVDARADLPQTGAVWAAPTPAGIAAALGRAVDHPRPGRVIAAGVRHGWGPAQEVVERVVLDELRRPALASATAPLEN